MQQFVIIGNSAAGVTAAYEVRKKNKESKIVIVSEEDCFAYYRCLLLYYLAGEIKEDNLIYCPESFYKENNINLWLNKKVIWVDVRKSRIIFEDKSQLNYDSLFIATGASPRLPQISGIKKRGVFCFRTLKDLNNIEGLLPVTKTACILGAGLMGIKLACALCKRNIEVKVITKSSHILSPMFDSQAAGFVQRKLEENGIEFVFGQEAIEIIGNGDIKAVKLDSGKVFACSLVALDFGIEPNVDLVKDTEIKVNRGIIVNNLLQTNVPCVYAGGDVCESLDLARDGLFVNAGWPIAVEQGKIAGANMLGNIVNYEGSLSMIAGNFFGLQVVSLGVCTDKEADLSLVSTHKGYVYKKLILKDKFLIGAILVGDINSSAAFLRLIKKRIDISSFKDKLLQKNFGFYDIMDF